MARHRLIPHFNLPNIGRANLLVQHGIRSNLPWREGFQTRQTRSRFSLKLSWSGNGVVGASGFVLTGKPESRLLARNDFRFAMIQAQSAAKAESSQKVSFRAN